MRIVPREEVTRRWQAWKTDRARKAARRDARPRVVNAETARGLTDTRERVFRGRRYRVPPLGFEDAVELVEHMDQFQQIRTHSSPQLSDLRVWFRDAARLAKRHCRPASALRRLVWHVSPNPFRRAPLPEVADMLGFTCGWAMIDLGLGPTSPDRPGTSPPTSRGS